MAGIDQSLPFYPLRIAGLNISDSRNQDSNQSGPLLIERLESSRHHLADRAIVPDEVEAIQVHLRRWIDDHTVDLVITTGGTGFSPRDVPPEAVRPLFRREMNSFSALFHQASFGTVSLSTMQSRTFAGQAKDTFIFCLPGLTGACRDGWDLMLGHKLDSRYRPCSLAGQIPRFRHPCA